MANDSNIVRYTAAELRRMRAEGGSRTDFARVAAKTEAELEADIASDPDWKDIPENWYEHAEMRMPAGKKLISLRLDPDIVGWFKQQGPGYQTRMNAVLRSFIEQAGKKRA